MSDTDINTPTDNWDEDIFKDTLLRYLGYANEVGESFRSLIHVRFVHLSYVVASGYVLADATDKGLKAYRNTHILEGERWNAISVAAGDTLIWQGLASVVIPGFTINRICALCGFLLRRTTQLPSPVRKWTTTAVGLSCIPLIIKPIDRSVHFMMDKTIRTFYPTHNQKDPIHNQKADKNNYFKKSGDETELNLARQLSRQDIKSSSSNQKRPI